MNFENRELIRLLPAVYQRTVQDPKRPRDVALLALLDVMTGMLGPDLEVLAELGTYFDRYQAPDAFVPLLASWLDLDWLFPRLPTRLDAAAAREISPLELGRLRELVAAATRLALVRGTAQGLLDFMETATNVRGLAVDEHVPMKDNAQKRSDDPVKERGFHLRVWVPKEGESSRARWRACCRRSSRLIPPQNCSLPKTCAAGWTQKSKN